jgi:hypothetical protein
MKKTKQKEDPMKSNHLSSIIYQLYLPYFNQCANERIYILY